MEDPQIIKMDSPVWHVIPFTVSAFRKMRPTYINDGFVSPGINLGMITLSVHFIEGIFESGIRAVSKDPIDKIEIGLPSYNKYFQDIFNKNLNALCQSQYEGLTVLFELRNALAHGRAIRLTTTIEDNDNWSHEFTGGYKKAWQYLIKKKAIKDTSSETYPLWTFCLEDNIADHFVQFVREYIIQLHAALALEGEKGKIFNKATECPDGFWDK